jgi:hypothetical protein
VFKSDAFRLLDPMAKMALLSILFRFSGWNNGKIAVSYRQIAADHNRKNQAWIGPAIAQLVAHSLIEIRLEGAWGPRKAREYRLTFASTGTPDKPIPATNEYLSWRATSR